MEPPAKRPRTGSSPLGQQNNYEDDELNFEPDEVSQMRDPGYQFEQSRAFAAFKLKSTFEHIFEKYERDFTGIGDEIDLRTGKIITNNGHLENMRNERDTGIPDEDEEDEGILLEDAFGYDEDIDEDANPSTHHTGSHESSDEPDDDDERTRHGKKDKTNRLPRGVSSTLRLGSEQRLSTASEPRPSWGSEPEAVDPTWRAPEIHQPKLGDSLMSKLHGARYRFPASQGSQSVWSSRPDSEQEKMTPEPARIDLALLSRARQESIKLGRPTSMKLLQAFTAEDENGDDILGVSVAERSPGVGETKNKPTRAEKLDASDTQEQPVPTLAGSSRLGSPDKAIATYTKTEKSSKKEPKKKQTVKTRLPSSKTTAEIAENESETVETHSKDDVAESEAGPAVPYLVTNDKVQKKSIQRLVIELPARVPAPEDITEVEDPEDVDTFVPAEQSPVATRKSNVPISGVPSNGSMSKSALETAFSEPQDITAEDLSVATEEQSKKDVNAPKEKFTRHEIDPSYAFSDDEEGIPTIRTRSRRGDKLALGRTVSNNDSPTSLASEALFKDVEASKNDIGKQTRRNSSNMTSLPNINGHLVENSNLMDFDFSEAGQADEPMETVENPSVSQGQSHPWQSAEDCSMIEKSPTGQSLELEKPSQQEFIAEGQGVVGIESTPITASKTLPEESQRLEVQDSDEDEGFTVTLLDEIDDVVVTEPEPESQPGVMDIELPTLPPPAETQIEPSTLPVPPKRGRGRPRKAASERTQKEFVSPMRRLNLQSSSPLKRYAAANLKARKPVNAIKASDTTTVKSKLPTLEREISSKSSTQAQQETEKTSPFPPRPSSTAKDSPHPHTPSSKSQTTKRTPSSRRSFVSLVPDDDGDELTLSLFRAWTNNSGGSSDGRRKEPYAPVLLAGPQTKITTPMKQRSHNIGSSGSGASKGRKRKAAWAFAATPTEVGFGSPSGSLVKTPGGRMRRCGEDGFKCDRDFCFTCL
ncbi:myb-like DNA-binding domain protein [Colletotrichum truncatum]|uniref:Myb-like DNA-binding domain protein n=1 Tax=Colletotrichum truncatum TaxID=5467 RepID=A0ACC3YVG2_COLTU|nr:myb-like DNA-binding domain protein [Colletotrichum truncatum]KAF6798318.1 myb-like DNA-binding domain protein [Colletotrichum truncatum]